MCQGTLLTKKKKNHEKQKALKFILDILIFDKNKNKIIENNKIYVRGYNKKIKNCPKNKKNLIYYLKNR